MRYEWGPVSSRKTPEMKMSVICHSIGREFTGNNLFLLRVWWIKAKTKYSLHRKRAGRALHCGKRIHRSQTRFVIPHKCTLLFVENKMKDDSWQRDFFPLASRPLPVAVWLPSLQTIFRCREGFIHWWTSFWWIVTGKAACSFLIVTSCPSVLSRCAEMKWSTRHKLTGGGWRGRTVVFVFHYNKYNFI